MEILGWLAPAAVVTLLAMVWAAWAGRPERADAERDEATYARFAKAIAREHPAAGRPFPVAHLDRSAGIAVRRPRRD